MAKDSAIEATDTPFVDRFLHTARKKAASHETLIQIAQDRSL
jgi:hypothetical protein